MQCNCCSTGIFWCVGNLGNKIHCYVLANVCTVWFLFAALSVHKSDITIEGLLQKRTKEKEGKKEKYDFVLEIESSMSYHLLSLYLLLSHISPFYVFWASVRHPSDLALCFIWGMLCQVSPRCWYQDRDYTGSCKGWAQSSQQSLQFSSAATTKK